jgi:hypothetical protein
MSRDEVHSRIGIPDQAKDVKIKCRRGGLQSEYYSFEGIREYFYILGKGLLGFDQSRTRYIVTVNYDDSWHVLTTCVCRASGVGILGL